MKRYLTWLSVIVGTAAIGLILATGKLPRPGRFQAASLPARLVARAVRAYGGRRAIADCPGESVEGLEVASGALPNTIHLRKLHRGGSILVACSCGGEQWTRCSTPTGGWQQIDHIVSLTGKASQDDLSGYEIERRALRLPDCGGGDQMVSVGSHRLMGLPGWAIEHLLEGPEGSRVRVLVRRGARTLAFHLKRVSPV